MASSSVPAPNVDPDLDHVVDDVDYEKMVGAYSNSGLLGLPSDTSHVYADGTALAVKYRAHKRALVLGKQWKSGATEFSSPTLTSNTSGNPRWDLVVLQLDRATWLVTEVVKTGTPAASPVLPSLQRDPDVNGDGTGKWEIPLAKVVVRSGATSIAAADVTPFRAYLAPQSLIATSDPFTMSLIVPTASLRVYQTDTGSTVVGTGSAFKVAFDDTGSLPIGPGGGWTSSMKVRKCNGIAYTNGLGFKRTGGVCRAGTDQALGWVPVACRPSETVGWTTYLSNGYNAHGIIDAATGTVILQDYWVDVPTGWSVVPQQLSWVAA